jgi:hypothetical protein
MEKSKVFAQNADILSFGVEQQKQMSCIEDARIMMVDVDIRKEAINF